MTKRMLVLTIGYDDYAADPGDAAALIEIFGRLVKVERGAEWRDPHAPSVVQKNPLTAVQFLDVADAPVARASTTDEPIEPAPMADEQPF